MKRIFLLAFSLLGFAAISQAQVSVTGAPAQDNNQAEIKFETLRHNFGTIPEGPEAQYSFKFTNVGTVPLVLTDVVPSCGCTTPVWPKEPLQPGKSAEIKIGFDTRGKSTFSKNITVNSNAKSGSVVLTIEGVVVKADQPAPQATPAPAPAPAPAKAKKATKASTSVGH